jgi:dihydroorotate dehydrogenase (NAD+) catalytic subunit
MAINWRKRAPILGNVLGGLSGPAIKPVVLRMVFQVAQKLPQLPIIAVGGIGTLDDVLEFLVAGASAVQIGTANFYNPTLAGRLVDDLDATLAAEGLSRVQELIGSLRLPHRG